VSLFSSSTQTVPDTGGGPRHVAIVTDGNGRWAKRRFLPRGTAHNAGVETVRTSARSHGEREAQALTETKPVATTSKSPVRKQDA